MPFAPEGLERVPKGPPTIKGICLLVERMHSFDLCVFSRRCVGLRPEAVLLIALSLLFAGCEKKGPSVPKSDLKRLADRYFNVLEAADVEEYVRLFHPAIQGQMADSLRRIATLEMTDWEQSKTEYRWRYSTQEGQSDAETSSLGSDALVTDLARFTTSDARLWMVTFRYWHGSQTHHARNHLLTQSNEGLHLFLPPDMETRVRTRLSDVQAFCVERQRDVDSFRNAMQAIVSAPSPEHPVEMSHMRYPLYIEGTQAQYCSCLISLGSSEVVACPGVAVGIEILAGTRSTVEQLLLTSSVGEGERLESGAGFYNRTRVEIVLKHLGQGVTRDDRRYTPWVFTKEISREPPGVVLLRAPDPNESRATAEQAFISCLDALERGLAVHSIVKYRVDSQRVGFYVDQDAKNVGDAFAVDLHAEIVDADNPAIRRKASFHGFPPSMRGSSFGYRSGHDKAFDAFRDWLISME